jgi:threonine dehydrogenase-like Zn-dependent dehydrogenase
MKATMLYGPGDIRFEERPEPKIVKPTDAIIKISATCVCGSDLWPYRGLDQLKEPKPMGGGSFFSRTPICMVDRLR